MSDFIFNEFKKEYLDGSIPSAFDADFVLVNSEFKNNYIDNDKLPAEKVRELTEFNRVKNDGINKTNGGYTGTTVVSLRTASGEYFKYEGNTGKNKFDAEMPMFITSANYKEFAEQYPEKAVYVSNQKVEVTTLGNLFLNKTGAYRREGVNGFYYVRTKQELAWCANKVNGEADGSRLTDYDNRISIVLGDDIGTLAATTDETVDRLEFCIGKYIDRPFNGILYGNNYGFVNIAIMCNHDNNGIVGNLGEDGILSYIKISGRTLLCNRNKIDLKHILDGSNDVNAGLLCGNNRGKIEFIDVQAMTYLINFFPDFTLVGNKTTDKISKTVNSDKYALFPDYLNINSRKNIVPYVGYFNEGIYAPSQIGSLTYKDASQVITDRSGEIAITLSGNHINNSIWPPKQLLSKQMDVYNTESHYITDSEKQKIRQTKTKIDASDYKLCENDNLNDSNMHLKDWPVLTDKKLLTEIKNTDTPFVDRSMKPHKFSRCAYYVSPLVGVNYGDISNCSVSSQISAGSTFVGFCGGIAGKFSYGNITNVHSQIALLDSECTNMYSTDGRVTDAVFEDSYGFANSMKGDVYTTETNMEKALIDDTSNKIRDYDIAIAKSTSDDTKYENLLSHYIDFDKLSISAIAEVGYDEIANNINCCPLSYTSNYQATPIKVEENSEDGLKIEYYACSASTNVNDKKEEVYHKFNVRITKKLTTNDLKKYLSLKNCFDSATYTTSAYDYIGVTDYASSIAYYCKLKSCLNYDNSTLTFEMDKNYGPYALPAVFKPGDTSECYHATDFGKPDYLNHFIRGTSPKTIKIDLERIISDKFDNIISEYYYDESSNSVKKGKTTFEEFRSDLEFNSAMRPIKNTESNEVHIPLESEVFFTKDSIYRLKFKKDYYSTYNLRSSNKYGIVYKLDDTDSNQVACIKTHFPKNLCNGGEYANKSVCSDKSFYLTNMEGYNHETVNRVAGGINVAYHANTSEYQNDIKYYDTLPVSTILKGKKAIRYKLAIHYDKKIDVFSDELANGFEETTIYKIINPQQVYSEKIPPNGDVASNIVNIQEGTHIGHDTDATWVAFSIYNVGGAFGNIALTNHTYIDSVSAGLTNYLTPHSSYCEYYDGAQKLYVKTSSYYDIGGLNKFGGFAAICEYDASNLSDHIINPNDYNVSNCHFAYGETTNREMNWFAGIASPLIAKINPIYECVGSFIEHNDGLGYGPIDPIALTLHDYGLGIDKHSPNYYTTDMSVNVPGKRFWKVTRTSFKPYDGLKELNYNNDIRYYRFSACRPVDYRSIARCLFDWSTITAGSSYDEYYTTSSIFQHTKVPINGCDLYNNNYIEAENNWFSGYKKIDAYTVFGQEFVSNDSSGRDGSEILNSFQFNYAASREYNEAIRNSVIYYNLTEDACTAEAAKATHGSQSAKNGNKYSLTAYYDNADVFKGTPLGGVDSILCTETPEYMREAFNILDNKRTIKVDDKIIDLKDNAYLVYDKSMDAYSALNNIITTKVYYSNEKPGYYTQFDDSFQNGEFDELLNGRKIDGSIYHMGTDCTPMQIKRFLNSGCSATFNTISAKDVQGLVVFAKYDNKSVPMMYIEKDFGDIEDGCISIDFDSYSASTLRLPTQKNSKAVEKMYANLIDIK